MNSSRPTSRRPGCASRERCVTANESLFLPESRISFDDNNDLPVSLLAWFDSGVKCLQHRDAWSVHTKGIQEGPV